MVALSLLTFSAPMLLATSMAGASITNDVCSGVGAATGTGAATAGSNNNSGCGSGKADLKGSIENIAAYVVNVLSIIVGIVAVIMIILGGFKYITSSGESGKVESAKKTLIMAIVGLILVALAQLIVHFVINTSTTITNPQP